MVLPQCDMQGAEIVRKKIENSLRMLDLESGEEAASFQLVWNMLVSDGHHTGQTLCESLFPAPVCGENFQ